MGLTSELILVSPMLLLCLGALLVLVLRILRSDGLRLQQVTLGVLSISLLAALFVFPELKSQQLVFQGFIKADPLSGFFSCIIPAGALLAVMLGLPQLKPEGIESQAEYYALLLFSAAGAMLFASAAEMVMLFIALETMSLALYCLCGSAPQFRRSAESALKYFILGSFSSAIMLFGIALIYGLTGTTVISEVAGVIESGSTGLNHNVLLSAFGLIVVGLIFKVAAVPFHFWVPDVYEGAPTPVTAFMACVIKAAAVGAALRVMWGAFEGLLVFWQEAVWIMSALTILFANVVAVRQRGLKRMLAYSSVAHAGYILMAFLAPAPRFGGGPAILFYLVAYTLMTMGAFGVVMAVRAPVVQEKTHDDISRFAGLGYRNPFLAVCLSLFLLSLAGLPPGMAGLMAKFFVFNATLHAGYAGLAVIGALGSVISCYYYLRVIVAMYFMETSGFDGPEEAVMLSSAQACALTACAAGVLVFGLFPSALYNLGASLCTSF